MGAGRSREESQEKPRGGGSTVWDFYPANDPKCCLSLFWLSLLHLCTSVVVLMRTEQNRSESKRVVRRWTGGGNAPGIRTVCWQWLQKARQAASQNQYRRERWRRRGQNKLQSRQQRERERERERRQIGRARRTGPQGARSLACERYSRSHTPAGRGGKKKRVWASKSVLWTAAGNKVWRSTVGQRWRRDF